VAATELEVATEVLSPMLAQAKLIFVTKGPEDNGALRSHVTSTYGQQTLSVPTFAMSPLTKTVVEVTVAPDFAPELSTSWNDVPAYVPVHPRGTGWQSGLVRVSHVTRAKSELIVATCTFW
jgi:hypothetical protein